MKDEYIDRFLDISKKCYIKMKEYSTPIVKGSRKTNPKPSKREPRTLFLFDSLHRWPSPMAFTDGLRRWFSQEVKKENMSIGSRKTNPNPRIENPEH